MNSAYEAVKLKEQNAGPQSQEEVTYSKGIYETVSVN